MYDLIVLDYELLAGHSIESTAECSRLLTFPSLSLVADRESWGPCDDAGVWGPPDILWKPLDPEAAYTKVCQLLVSEGTR